MEESRRFQFSSRYPLLFVLSSSSLPPLFGTSSCPLCKTISFTVHPSFAAKSTPSSPCQSAPLCQVSPSRLLSLSLTLSVLEKLRKARPQFPQIANLILTRLFHRRLIVRLDEVCGRPAKVCGRAAIEVGIIWWCVSYRSIVFFFLTRGKVGGDGSACEERG